MAGPPRFLPGNRMITPQCFPPTIPSLKNTFPLIKMGTASIPTYLSHPTRTGRCTTDEPNSISCATVTTWVVNAAIWAANSTTATSTALRSRSCGTSCDSTRVHAGQVVALSNAIRAMSVKRGAVRASSAALNRLLIALTSRLCSGIYRLKVMRVPLLIVGSSTVDSNNSFASRTRVMRLGSIGGSIAHYKGYFAYGTNTWWY